MLVFAAAVAVAVAVVAGGGGGGGGEGGRLLRCWQLLLLLPGGGDGGVGAGPSISQIPIPYTNLKVVSTACQETERRDQSCVDPCPGLMLSSQNQPHWRNY